MSSGVEFDEDSFSFNKPRSMAGGNLPAGNGRINTYNSLGDDQSGMAKWLIKKGFAKSSRGAQIILLVIVVINIVITIVVVKYLL